MPENNMNFQPMPKRFMVWDRQNKVFLTQPLEIWQIVIHFSDRVSDLVDDNLQENRYVFCQSTNLFDAGTSEIFEGSIIRDEDEGYLSVVEYREGDFVGVDPCTGKVIDSLSAMARFSEVISHILSNPELLEEKNV